jgi:predicted acetyltransferase
MVCIEVIPATPDQEPILANLLELYIYDFSEFLEMELGADGRFGYPNLPLFWREPGRHPFLIRVDGRWSGFVLLRQGSVISGDTAVWDLAEFFIVRRNRRRGIGMEAAHQVWRRFPGRWEVRVMEANQPAREFWKRAIAAFAGEEIPSADLQKDGKPWRVFSFESRSQT